MTCITPTCRRKAVPDFALCDQCLDGLMFRLFGPKMVLERTDFSGGSSTKALRRVLERGIIKASQKEKPDVR
jgi:hypothetical protein